MVVREILIISPVLPLVSAKRSNCQNRHIFEQTGHEKPHIRKLYLLMRLMPMQETQIFFTFTPFHYISFINCTSAPNTWRPLILDFPSRQWRTWTHCLIYEHADETNRKNAVNK